MSTDETGSWSWEQDKSFENALAVHGEDFPDGWKKIAADVSGKTVGEIKKHL